jgi:pimeloyl-ACP methyl ester carboxylesterase
LGALIATTLMLSLSAFSMGAGAAPSKPTIVLVHGAFASPEGWDGVAAALHKDGYRTATPELGLESVSNDVAIVQSTLNSIPGDKILVGHSYGGFVITNAATGRADVRGLVYTAAYVPDKDETITSMSVGYTPGAFLNDLVPAGPFPFFIVNPQSFPDDFAQDLNPKLGAEIGRNSAPRVWASSSRHRGMPPGTFCRRGTQSRLTTVPSILPSSGSWLNAPGRPRSSSPPRATWAASPTTRHAS